MRSYRKIISGFTTIVLFAAAVSLIFIPNAKAVFIRGLMKVGFYQAKPEKNEISSNAPLNLAQVVFKDGSGNLITLSEQKGKVLFINFWATWCPPCRIEMPYINKLYQNFKDNKDISFLMVDIDGSYDKSRKYMDSKKFNLPVHTPVSDIPKSMMNSSIPTTLIIDKQGKMVFHHEGVADFSNKTMIDYLNKLSSQ
jgi:thiol-disulfide isomerase/thioredoxin